MMAPSRRRPALPAAAAAAALALLLASPAAAMSMLPFGTKDCLPDGMIRSVDGYNLNPPLQQISGLPGGFANLNAPSSKAAIVSSIASPAAAVAAHGQAYGDGDASVLSLLPPYWRAGGASARPPPPSVVNFTRHDAGAALAEGQAIGATIAAAVSASAAAQGYGSPAALAAARANAVAPTTITIGDLFSVTYYGTWKLVTNLVVGQHYVLYQCGTPNPVAAGAAGIPANAKVFKIPLHSLAVPDTTALAFIGMYLLKLQDRVVAAPSFCTDACGQFIAAKCGDKADLDPFTWALPPGVYDSADAILDTTDNQDPKAIVISAPGTPPALRPQWLKFASLFFNRDGIGSSNGDDRMRTYMRKSNIARNYIQGNKPKVIWIASMDYWQDWGYPNSGTQYIIYGAKFKKTFVNDAGGNFIDGRGLLGRYPSNVVAKELFSKDGEFMDVAINPMSDPKKAKQALMEMLRQADVIIDETYFVRPVCAPSVDAMLARYRASSSSPVTVTYNDVASIPAFANKRVYTVGKLLSMDSMGTDWFETAMVESDQVLDDFILAITPAAKQGSGRVTKWLQRLGVDSVVNVQYAKCLTFNSCQRTAPLSTCPNAYPSCKDGTFVLGNRAAHCPSSSCKPACWCCPGMSQGPGCASTCAAANKANCGY